MSKYKKHSEEWFNHGFHNFISSSFKIEIYRRKHKKIPKELKLKFDRSRKWLSELTDYEYGSLIH